MLKFFSVFLALGSSCIAVHAQTAPEVLQKVASVYASCRSYSDEAQVKVQFASIPGPQLETATFRTRFVRSAGFRFELLWDPERHRVPWVFWRNVEGAQVNGVQISGPQNVPFDNVLARIATGSYSGSLIIPQLLVPEDSRLLGLMSLITDAKITGEEKVDGRRTFRIEGRLLARPLKLWIDKSEFLIVKTVRKVVTDDGESIIKYKPRLNGDIPSAELTAPPPPPVKLRTIPPFFSEWPGSPLAKPLSSSTQLLESRTRAFGSSLARESNQSTGRHAQGSPGDEDVIRVETDLVVTNVLVLDRQGKAVTGLTKDDFVVKEDDKVQEVTSLSLGDNKDLPRSIVLIIDYSGSQVPYLKTSIESAKMLVDKLNPKDRIALVTDDAKLLVDFTSDQQLVKAQLDNLRSEAISGRVGASDQYDALLATLKELFDNNGTRPIVIFQTDGDQLDALKGGEQLSVEPYSFPRKYSFEDVLTATERSRATVYAVIPGIKYLDLSEAELVRRAKQEFDLRRRANLQLAQRLNFSLPQRKFEPLPDEFYLRAGQQWLLRQTAVANLAKFTGTIPEFLEEPEQADEIYNRILTDIDRRYIISYYPTNRTRDGGRRKVSIEVRGHPEYSVGGQKAYFARLER